MSLIYLSSTTCKIEQNLDTPIQLKEGEDHYITLLNLNYSNVFANTTTQYNTIDFWFNAGQPNEVRNTVVLPSNRIMTLEEIYEWAGNASKVEGDQFFNFVIDRTNGMGKIEPVENINDLMAAHGFTDININQVENDKMFFRSIFFYHPQSLFYSVSGGLQGSPYTKREPSVSDFNQLFITTPLVQNTGRTVVNGNCIAIPMIAAVSSAADPFEYVQYTAFQPMKCKLSSNKITNLQFVLKTENNASPDVVEGSNVELSILVKIE